MMATYTIYEPNRCDSPLQFVSGSFWDDSGKFHLTIRNAGQKTIKRVEVGFDHLMTKEYRRRPYQPIWDFSTDIAPGQEQTFEMPGHKRDLENTVFGWEFFPRDVLYEDGTTWQLKDDGQCFQVFWQDKSHLQPAVLPPIQLELNED